MKKTILELHEKILEYLVEKWENNNLYFMPRLTNKYNRLNLGYYFLGNDDYLQFSFWKGQDEKSRVHNISFVVNSDKSCSIQLSGKSSEETAKFLEIIASKIGGFREFEKNRWIKEYDNRDYLNNLEEFINNEKIIIDNLIKNNQFDEIKLLDSSYNKNIVRVIELANKNNDFNFNYIGREDKDEDLDEGNLKNTKKIKRRFNGEIEIVPVHNKMQNAIWKLLKESKVYEIVQIEKNNIDIKAKTESGVWHYFEIKTNNPKKSIRNALGQIMEYAYFPNSKKAEKLYIISDERPKSNVKKYLRYLREKFDLPVYYRYFDWNEEKLSDDY
ncbi:hypothetical protein [Orenia marismortui]|uniref:Uncharacterized protein n=1 Tax=Orenia marismortui TaxID=46469 RepID=A0A4R8GAJ3_9FIRM|nr:hypothetical protein [Orenia marismortui]TDX42352.1 hypothetical protein C7959_1831 [Orenia marismortui]